MPFVRAIDHGTHPHALLPPAATDKLKKEREEMAQFEHDKRSLDWNSKNDDRIREQMGLGQVRVLFLFHSHRS